MPTLRRVLRAIRKHSRERMVSHWEAELEEHPEWHKKDRFRIRTTGTPMGDAVTAHAITNALLSLAVLGWDQWQWW